MAGLTVGFWRDRAEIRTSTDRLFLPSMSGPEREEKIRGWEHAIRCARMWSQRDVRK